MSESGLNRRAAFYWATIVEQPHTLSEQSLATMRTILIIGKIKRIPSDKRGLLGVLLVPERSPKDS